MNKSRGKLARRPGPDVLVFSLLETAQAVEARLEAALSSTGLSMAKLAVLHVPVEAQDPLPLSELAERQQCAFQHHPAGRPAREGRAGAPPRRPG